MEDNVINIACENNLSLEQFKVSELKEYLSNRNLNVSGRKGELIDRVKGANKLLITDKNTLLQSDKLTSTERETNRFALVTGENIQKPYTLTDWSVNFQTLPDCTEKDLYNYIVFKKNSKRQLKSKIFYEDGHVHKLEINAINEECSHCYIRALVLPSFPTADKKKSPEYQPWVLLSKVTGCIHSAYCQCTAGEGECCNHIGALLFGIVDLALKKKSGTLSSTSNKCLWSVMPTPRKRKLSPKRSQNITYKKNSYLEPTRKLCVEKNEQINVASGCTVNIERFKKRLEENNLNVGWLKNFPSSSVEDKLPELNNINFMYMDNVKLSECQKVFDQHFDSLSFNKEQIILTEILTRGQNTTAWKIARQERLTSSNYGAVCKRKKAAPDNLLKDMMYTSFSSHHTEYGKKHEKVAKKMYIKYMRTEHRGLIVKDSGLIVSLESPYLGASPDGVVYCSHCEESTGLLEIKCPSSLRWRMKTPKECCLDTDFCCKLEGDTVKLKKNHNYHYQVQGLMGVSGQKWCDFVIWTCGGISIERITFDQDMWTDMHAKLALFYRNSVIPELYTRRIKRGLTLF